MFLFLIQLSESSVITFLCCFHFKIIVHIKSSVFLYHDTQTEPSLYLYSTFQYFTNILPLQLPLMNYIVLLRQMDQKICINCSEIINHCIRL